MKSRSKVTISLLAATLAASPALADLTYTGEVFPDPTTWTSSIVPTIGYSSTGTVVINSGTSATSGSATLGSSAGSSGTVTIDGSASQWTASDLDVGLSGTGTLNLTNGGTVAATGATYVGLNPGSTGTINFGPNGGTLTTNTLWASPNQVTGTGTINTQGLVTDANLVFDATHGSKQTLTWNNPSQNVTVNLNLDLGIMDYLGVGYQTAATMAIRDGVTVTTAYQTLGWNTGSTGTATISGAGSALVIRVKTTIGNGGTGTLNITNGGKFDTTGASIQVGNLQGSTGSVTVNGAGSTWANNGSIIGLSGTGTVSVGNGGNVSAGFDWYLGYYPGSVGNVSFDGTNSTFNDLGSLYVSLHGVGTFTVTHGAQASVAKPTFLGFYAGSTGTMIIDGAGSKLTNTNSSLYLGYYGNGNLTITNGGNFTAGGNSSPNYLTFMPGAVAAVTVDGTGSTFTGNSRLYVGYNGVTSFSLTRGGQVFNTGPTTLGNASALTVDGVGSKWTNSNSSLSLYALTANVLRITNGGSVVANALSIGQSCLFSMDIGKASVLNVGTGVLTNNGTMQLKAAPTAAAKAYTPITAGSWSGSGTVQPLGGTWNSTNHTFTVTAPATGTTGHAATFNTLTTQRILITDPVSLVNVAAAFQPTTSASNLTLTANLLTAPQTALLNANIPAGAAILAGWTFAASGYTSGNPVYLSLDAGPGFSSASTFQVWHYDGTFWTPYSAPDLNYDGTYANFTVTGFSGYALATVPEPASLALLALAAIPLALRRRAK